MMLKPLTRTRAVSVIVKALVVLFSVCGQSGGSQCEMRLTPSSRCPGQVMSWASLHHTVAARSILECATYCIPDIQCVSVSFDTDNKVCHFGNSTAHANCSNTAPAPKNWKYYEKNIACQNGGVLNTVSHHCTCPDGYHGNWCDVTIADCEEYLHKGLLTESAVYLVKPAKAAIPFPVFCDYLPAFDLMRTRIACRDNLTFSFNHSWQEYLAGFGSPASSSHWLGLQKIHLLTTSRNYQLRFRVKMANFTNFYQYYDNFVLEGESGGFSLAVDVPAANMGLGDCLQDLVGAQFSTHDVDHDGSSAVNCAQKHGGGWWFKGDNCSSCNPFGPILSPFDGSRKGVEGEAFWTHKLGNRIPFSFFVYLVAMP